MSKFRYALGIIGAVAAFVFALFCDFAEGFERVLIAYLIAASAAELIWWSSFVIRVPFFFLKIIAAVFMFWVGLTFSSVLFFIIGIAIATPIFGFIASLLGITVCSLLILSAIFFPIHAFTLAGDLY